MTGQVLSQTRSVMPGQTSVSMRAGCLTGHRFEQL